MIKISTRFAAPLALLLAVVAGCSEVPPNPVDDPAWETVINGSAPLNVGGKIRIAASGGYGDDKIYEGEIDDAGRFSAKMRGTFGRFALEASGGTFVEPATGTLVQHAGETLHAALLGVEQLAEVEVAITPWTEIAFARGRLDGYAEGLKALNDTLACQNASYTRLLLTPPSAPSADKPVQSLSVDALAYLYLAGFSQLAADLSDQLNLQPGARLTSMRLAKALAADFSDGRIDGRQHGVRVLLIEANALPENLLRQPLGQALRRFLNGPRNESSLHEAAAMDLLRCVSTGADPQLGPVGEPLDTEGPLLNFVTPQSGAYLSSKEDLVCEAKDVSGVKSLSATLQRGEEDVAAALGRPSLSAVPGTGQVRLSAPLLLDRLETGPVQVRCEAVDAWGNKSEKKQPFHVNRGGRPPRLIMSAENSREVSSVVQVRCLCEDDPYSQRCELLPGAHTQSLGSAVTGNQWTLYTWDTRHVLDGTYTLTCGNWSQGIDGPITHSISTRVKNHQPGSATGFVSLDSSVEHVTVTAMAFENGELGPELGTVEASDGAFSVPITNEYRGPVLLVAEKSKSPALNQPQAKFQNVPLDATMPLGNGKLRLLLKMYEPGQHFSALSINVATTMAESVASALWRHTVDAPGSFAEAVDVGHAQVGRYLSPTRPFDVRETNVAYLGQAARSAGDNEVLLGLFHVGLSRLAVEYSIQHCQRRTCITVTDIMEAMRQDLTDGRLDGRDINGARPSLGHGAYLSEDFFRIELARAIRRWLDRAPFMDDHRETINQSGLAPNAFCGRDQFLQNLAGHDSSLFGGRPGAVYDEDGPELHIQVLNADGLPMGLNNTLGRTRFRIVVDATDDTGVAWIRAAIAGKTLDNSQPARAEHAEYWVDTNDYPDGEIEVVVDSQDGAGNRSVAQRVMFVVDKVNPTVALGRSEIWSRDGRFRVTGTVSKSPLMVQVFDGGLPLSDTWELPEGDMTFAFDVTLACGMSHTLHVRVRDEAGNDGDGWQVIHCDDQAPTIVTRPRDFIQEGNVEAVYGDDLGSSIRYEPHGDSIQLAWPARLEKYFSRLDLLPEKGLTVSTQNLPVLAFDVADQDGGRFGSQDDHVVVEYQYRVDGVVKKEWARLSYPGHGVEYEIPLSYQTLSQDLATADPNSQHQIAVRAIDLAGNAVVKEYRFFMAVLAPPIWFGACDNSQDVRHYTLRDLTLHRMFERPLVELVQGKIKYALGLPAESLAPSGDLQIRFSLPEVEANITHISGEKYLARYKGMDVHRSLCGHGQHHLLFETPSARDIQLNSVFGRPDLCKPDIYPENPSLWSIADEDRRNDPMQMPSDLRLRHLAGELGKDGTGYYHIQSDTTTDVSWSVVHPQLKIDGQDYNWSQAVTAHPDFDGSRAARYRLHQFDLYGFDTFFDQAQPRQQGRIQQFDMQAYIDGFRVSAGPLVAEARHARLGLAVPVQFDMSCRSGFTYDAP